MSLWTRRSPRTGETRCLSSSRPAESSGWAAIAAMNGFADDPARRAVSDCFWRRRSRVDEIFGKPILTQEEVRMRVRELGRQITLDYAQKDLLLIGILKGAFAFYADLARAIGLPLRVDFLVASSNDKKMTMTEAMNVRSEMSDEIAGSDL